MVNVYVRVGPGGCVIQKAGGETAFPDLRSARSQNEDAADAFARLRKLERLATDGELKFSSTYPLTPHMQALTGEFQESGTKYQVAVFLEKGPEGEKKVKAVQTFPLQPSAIHRDVHITDPELLSFLNSSRLFVKA